MADLSAWLIPALGPGYLIFRRLFYFACISAGSYLAFRDELILTEKEAYELGRRKVLKTLMLRITAVDWAALWAGLGLAVENWRGHALIAWRGFKRDYRLCKEWVQGKLTRGLPESTRQLLRNAEEAEAGFQQGLVSTTLALGENVTQLQQRIGQLVQRGDERTLAENRELLQLRAWLREAYEARAVADSDPNRQPLLAAPQAFLPPLGNPWPRIAIAVALVALVFGLQWRAADSRADALARAERNVRGELAVAAARMSKMGVQIENNAKACLEQITQVADETKAKQKAAAAERQRRQRREQDKAVSGSAPPVIDPGEWVRDIVGGEGGEPSAPAGDSSPGAMSGGGGEPAAPAGAGGVPQGQ